MTKQTWEEELKKIIPEKTDNVIIHGYRQLTRGKIKQFIQSLLDKQKEEIPYSVSEWRKIGIERGYYDYFEQEVKQNIGKEFKKWFKSDDCEGIIEVIERITGIKV